MARETIAQVAQRVAKLEGCYLELDSSVGELREEVRAGFKAAAEEQEQTRKWLGNGFTDKVASIIAVKLVEFQNQLWEREREDRRLQLEEQKEANRTYGQEKDRRMTLRIALLALIGPSVTAFVTWILTR